MKLAVFSTKNWVKDAFEKLRPQFDFDITYLEPRLSRETVSLAQGYDSVCVFVNDILDSAVIDKLAEYGIKTIALRCAGFNNVDLKRAQERGIFVVRVPAYSPYAVAEHALGMILALNRKFYRAYNRVRDGNFSLDGLLGFDLRGKTIGVIGTGKIGQIFAELLQGFGVEVLAYDKYPNKALGKKDHVRYVELQELYAKSDIVSLHCPLTHETYHIINDYAINSMKKGVMIINTSRGPLINTNSVINGLKTGQIAYVGLDVYEEEADLFFEDLSDQVIQDDLFVRLQTFPNVLITGHQAFFTKEAVDNIAHTTFKNLADIMAKGDCANKVLAENAFGK